MAVLRKAHYIRLLIAALIIMSVLFIDMTSSMMVLLLIFSSLLSLLNLLLDIYNDFKNKDFLSNGLIVLIVTFVLFLAHYEYEAAVFSLTYSICEILIEKFQSRMVHYFIYQIDDKNVRGQVSNIVKDENNLSYNSEHILCLSIKKPLVILILMACLLTILLPVIGHYNFAISTYRCNIVFFLSSPAIILASTKVLGCKSIVEAAKIGVLFNNANAVEIQDSNEVIYDLSSQLKPEEQKPEIEYYTDKNINTFKNIIAHVIYQSNYSIFKPLKNDLNYEVDINLITDFSDYDNGIICTVNNMPIYFGNYEFINNLSLNVNPIDENDLFLFMSDRFIGEIYIPVTNVSVKNETELDVISNRIGDIVEKNAFISVGVKAVLVFLGLLGFMKIWIAVLIEAGAAIITIFNTRKL